MDPLNIPFVITEFFTASIRFTDRFCLVSISQALGLQVLGFIFSERKLIVLPWPSFAFLDLSLVLHFFVPFLVC